jgi:lysophospholipid acyltransferase (LPLAT)-like uncharacterized protein
VSERTPLSVRRRIKVGLASLLGMVIVRVLGLTWRVRFDNAPVLLGAREGARQPVVLALWHGELLPIAWAHRRRSIAVLISTHSDGEIIARVMRSLGFRPLRGSSSRGGARVLLEGVRVLGEGLDVGFTTDGPRGPRRVAAAGAGVAAAKGGVPVVTIGAVVDRAWRLRSWDQFTIPKPFATIRVRYGAPLRARGSSASDGEALLPEIQHSLLTVCDADRT